MESLTEATEDFSVGNPGTRSPVRPPRLDSTPQRLHLSAVTDTIVLPQPNPVPTSNDGKENKEEDVKMDINEENDAKEKNKDSNKEDIPSSDVTINIDGENDTKENNKDSNKENEKEDDVEEDKETKKPLLDDDSIKIEMKPDGEGEDTPTLPLPDKKEIDMDEEKPKGKLPIYLFPCTRIKEAWNTSTNIFQFFFTSICIIFQTVGWFTCVGGVPFISLAMLIIGSIYIHDCRMQPNIPVYLVVSGVIGTLQHVITIWTKYVPKNAQGRLKVYRSYCNVTNGLFHLFLMIWFILGCIWVYSIHSNVDFIDPQKEEYCHKTLYYFTFWILNLSFIFLGLIVVLSLCFLLVVIATPK